MQSPLRRDLNDIFATFHKINENRIFTSGVQHEATSLEFNRLRLTA